jgi:hypothetical protein
LVFTPPPPPPPRAQAKFGKFDAADALAEAVPVAVPAEVDGTAECAVVVLVAYC